MSFGEPKVFRSGFPKIFWLIFRNFAIRTIELLKKQTCQTGGRTNLREFINLELHTYNAKRYQILEDYAATESISVSVRVNSLLNVIRFKHLYGLPNNVISILGATSRIFCGEHVLKSNFLLMKRLTNTHRKCFSWLYENCSKSKTWARNFTRAIFSHFFPR